MLTNSTRPTFFLSLILLLGLSFSLSFGLSLRASAADLPLPLEAMPGKTLADVKSRAATESTAGPVWGNAPDPKDLPVHQTFRGMVTASAGMTKLAIFSDDGCDVYVDGTLVWSAKDKGQALPDLPNSLHELPVTLTPGDHSVQIDYSNIIYTVADASNPPDIDGCTLFQYGPIPVVRVSTSNQWQPNPAAVGQTITSPVTAQVDNPLPAPSGHHMSERWVWTTSGVYQSPDGTSGTFTPYIGYAIGWTQSGSATTFSGTFNDSGYYIIKVTATVTYHDDDAGSDVGTYSGDGYIGGDATDLAPPAAAPRSAAGAQAAGASPGKGVRVTTSGISVTFKEVVKSSGLEVTLPNSTDTPKYGHDLTIPVPGLIVPFDPNPNPYHGNINNALVDINPQPSPNQIKFQTIDSAAGAITVSPSILSYSASEYGLLATGLKVGETGGVDVVPTAAGASPLAHLKVAVLPYEKVTVAFHLLSDTADATHAAHSTSRTAADVDAMISTMNSIWNKQGNVFFVRGSVDSVKYPSHLNDSVSPTELQYWSGNGEVSGELNVYFVWRASTDGTNFVPAATAYSAPASREVEITAVGDFFTADNKIKLSASDEGKILAHEAGHALGIEGDYLYDPDYLMTHDVSSAYQVQNSDGSYSITVPTRIHYEEAKTANPFAGPESTGQK